MRKALFLLPLLIGATPAAAQSGAAQLPPGLTDPATIHRVTGSIRAISDAFLDLKVGEIQAAIDGRRATMAERRLTVRDLGRRENPDFDRDFDRQVAAAGPRVEQGIRAVSDTIPVVMQSLEQAQGAIERAIANMPDPTYPRR